MEEDLRRCFVCIPTKRTTQKLLTDKTFEKETGEEIAIEYHLPPRDHKDLVGNMRAAAGVMISSICLLHQGTFSFMTSVQVTRGATAWKTPKESPYSRIPYVGCRLSDRSRDGDIDLNKAIANARTNLAEGRSPGAGLESAFDQADAAFADLIVTSVDQQGLNLDDEALIDLAKGGMMDEQSKSKKSKGVFGDVWEIFSALSGGAHIVRRDDGSL